MTALERSLVALCAVVGLAEQLAVRRARLAALRPRRDMVGVHLLELPDPRRVRVVAVGAERTVRNALLLRLVGLLRVDDLLRLLVETPHVEEPRVRLAAQHELEVLREVLREVAPLGIVAGK